MPLVRWPSLAARLTTASLQRCRFRPRPPKCCSTAWHTPCNSVIWIEGDPAGAWTLVMLDNISQVLAPADSLRYGAAAFALLVVPGFLLLALLSGRQRMAATLERLGVLGAALENSPLAVVVTDARGVIDCGEPRV